MTRARFVLLAALAAAASAATSPSAQALPGPAETSAWLRAHPGSLPHWPTPDELGRMEDVGRTFVETDPPVGDTRMLAEFEPMEAVLVRYPFGLPLALIAAMSERTPVLTLVSGASQETTVRAQYAAAGVDLASCSFLHDATNSWWTRDYGPWFVETESGVAVVDFPYNRPRPADDDVPLSVADWMGAPVFGMDLVHTGGNWMCDGWGTAASTTLVLEENPGLSAGEVDGLVSDYLGVDAYFKIPDPNGEYIDHIDCWAKFLDVDKVLVRRVPPAHAQYDEIEAAAAVFETALSSWGTPYEVWRVDTPADQPYTNSLILNETVYVPVTGSSWDDDALAVYAEAMPGYEVLGFTGSWYSTDALHCRAKGVGDRGLLALRHRPLAAGQEPGVAAVDARIRAWSGEPLLADSLLLHWRADGGAWQAEPLAGQGGDLFSAELPLPAGAEVEYWLSAVDGSGRRERQPRMGALDPHRLQVGQAPLLAPAARLGWEGGQLRLAWDPPAQPLSVLVERASELTGPWETVAQVLPPDSLFVEPLPADARGFYRLRAVAP